MAARARRSKYSDLLENAGVKRWYSNVARGSRVTADVYLRRVGYFCASLKLTPTELASKNERKTRDLLMDFVSSMEKQGYAGSYIESIVKAVKAWLSHNYVEMKVRIKIKGARETPSLKEERVPTQEELKKIFLSGDKKARVASVLVAHSGLRLKTLGNYEGQEGLRIRDLPEISIEDDTVDLP